MAILLSWDNDEETIIRLTYDGPRSWSEWAEVMEKLQKMLDEIDHRVDVITDLTEMLPPEDIVTRMGDIAESPPYTHPNVRYVVLVGAAEYVDRLVGLFTTLYPDVAPRVIRAETIEEARAVIGTRPPTNQ